MTDREKDAASADEGRRAGSVEKQSTAAEPLAVPPKGTSTGAVKPPPQLMDRPGTEADEPHKDEAATDEAAKKTGGGLPGPGPGRDGEQAAAYRENDA